MKEYRIENKKDVDTSRLQIGFIPKEQYHFIHQNTIIPCHDVFIYYKGGFLLVNRNLSPAKDEYFPIGGRIMRGRSIEDSLMIKAKEECNLELENIELLDTVRTFWSEDPFGHGQGTDTLNFVYSARGKGNLKLDENHQNPITVNLQQYRNKDGVFRGSLHPYVRDHLDSAFFRVDWSRE